MQKFIITNGVVETVNLQDDYLRDSFPVAVYTIKKNLAGFYLQHVMDSFELPEKIYGSTLPRVQKIKRTFERRPSTTGILMTGPKGTGKSLLAKAAANEMIKSGYPVIRISDPWSGDEFNTFIQELGDCVLVFDEFAKTYYDASEEVDLQEDLLSLFDGLASSKKLILMTENKYSQIDDLYKNRPSRVYYSWQYSGVEKEIIEGYCQDNLINKELVGKIIEIGNKMPEFSFDVLQSVVEECNANLETGLDFDEYISDLNLDITTLITYMELIGFDQEAALAKNKELLATVGPDSEIQPMIELTPIETFCEVHGSGDFHCRMGRTTGGTNTFYFKIQDAKIEDEIYTFNMQGTGVVRFRKVQLPKISDGNWDAY